MPRRWRRAAPRYPQKPAEYRGEPRASPSSGTAAIPWLGFSPRQPARAPAQVQAREQVEPRVRAAHTAISYVCQRGASSAQLRPQQRGKAPNQTPFQVPRRNRAASCDFPGKRWQVRPPARRRRRPATPLAPAAEPGWPRAAPPPAPPAPAARAPQRPYPRSCSLMAAAARRRRGGRNSASAQPCRSAPLRPPRRQGGTAAAREGWREKERERGREGGGGAAPPRSAPARRRCRRRTPSAPVHPLSARLRGSWGQLAPPRPPRGCAAILEEALGASYDLLFIFLGVLCPGPGRPERGMCWEAVNQFAFSGLGKKT